jgi:glycosyltransferase involved in cell wall biosynthesis
VVLVSGAWPPTRCGVGDYTERLTESLAAGGIDVIRFGAEIDFGTWNAGRIARRLAAIQPDLVHLQYPTVGYGRSLTPAAIPLLVRGVPHVVTIHEFSSFRYYKLPWFGSFCFADTLIFTTDSEREIFYRRMWLKPARTEIVPIGSNIPVGPNISRVPGTVGYFGLLMPVKGIEAFLALAELSKDTDLRFALIGAIPSGFEAYGRRIVEQATSMGIELHLEQTPEQVAERLKSLSYCYLAFPEGVTEKRGSVLAALVNGAMVLTPHGPDTPDWLRSATIDTPSPEAAARYLLDRPTPPLHDKFERIRDRIDWRTIAARHVEIYMSVTGVPPHTGRIRKLLPRALP